MIDPRIVAALRLIRDIVGADRVVVIGATVTTVLIDIRYGLDDGRATRDVDAVVKAPSWDDYNFLCANLIAAGFTEGREPHRLYYNGAEIDLIPYSPTLAPGNRLRWPDDVEMSTLGLEEAFRCARPESIGDVTLPMVTVAGSVLLKFIAYSDRPADRQRDLEDIFHSFEHYGEHPDELRFNIAGLDIEVDDRPVTYEEAGAYLLGQELKALATPESLRAVHTIVASLLVKELADNGGDDRQHSLNRRLLMVFAAALQR